jgi:NADH dehydrogenase [ubiquinone] 1 alpha subcomplex assembly factor 1
MNMETAISRSRSLIQTALASGLLLLPFAGTPLHAADSDTGSDLGREHMVTDFTSASPDLGWYVQNDNVMGGRSEGGFDMGEDELIFAGSTNTNGGGFSSIRTSPFELNLAAHEGIQLRVKGDGRQYTWQLQTEALYRGYRVSYWAEFDTKDGEWITVNIPFAKFYPQFRGFKLDGPELDTSQITEMGLYIYDKKDGPFELRVDSIQAYSAATP